MYKHHWLNDLRCIHSFNQCFVYQNHLFSTSSCMYIFESNLHPHATTGCTSHRCRQCRYGIECSIYCGASCCVHKQWHATLRYTFKMTFTADSTWPNDSALTASSHFINRARLSTVKSLSAWEYLLQYWSTELSGTGLNTISHLSQEQWVWASTYLLFGINDLGL